MAALKDQGRSVPDLLDELARRYGVHDVAAVSRRVADIDEAAELMRRLRGAPPAGLAGFAATVTDITDALIFTGGDDRNVGQGGGAAFGDRAEAEVLLGDSLRGRPETCRVPGERAGALRAELLADGATTGELARPELAVARIAETRHDIGDLVEPVIDRYGEQPNIGRRFLKCCNAFRCRHRAEHGDLCRAVLAAAGRRCASSTRRWPAWDLAP